MNRPAKEQEGQPFEDLTHTHKVTMRDGEGTVTVKYLTDLEWEEEMEFIVQSCFRGEVSSISTNIT